MDISLDGPRGASGRDCSFHQALLLLYERFREELDHNSREAEEEMAEERVICEEILGVYVEAEVLVFWSCFQQLVELVKICVRFLPAKDIVERFEDLALLVHTETVLVPCA